MNAFYKQSLAYVSASLVVFSASVGAGEVTGLTTVTAGKPIKAADINANFEALKNAANGTNTRTNELYALLPDLQKLLNKMNEKIGSLSVVGANIVLAPSSVLVGNTLLTVTGNSEVAWDSYVKDDGASASTQRNSRYQIFAVPNNSNGFRLVVSQSENSQGPVGNSAWRLVGSFYTNGLTARGFGSFVNIEGVPMTESGIQFNFTISWGPTSAYTTSGFHRIVGDRWSGSMVVHFNATPTTQDPSPNGDGALHLYLPPSDDNTSVLAFPHTNLGLIHPSFGAAAQAGVRLRPLQGTVYGSGVSIYSTEAAGVGAVTLTAPFGWRANDFFAMEVDYEVAGFTNTPIIAR